MTFKDETYRLLITGSRDWTDEEFIDSRLTLGIGSWIQYPWDVTLVSGNCPTGADKLCEDWARRNKITVELHPANWDKYGKRAGFLRNKEMVDLGANRCIAFRLDNSKGTTHTIDLAYAANIPTTVYDKVS